MSEKGGAARARLAEVIASHREELIDELVKLEWAATAGGPAELVTGPEAVRPRVEVFVDLLSQGLATGDWTAFDQVITVRTIELLSREIITQEDLDKRALTITSRLLPAVLEESHSAPMLMALYEAMQSLSSRIVAGYNRHLLEELRRVDEVKTMFLRVMTHEIRAPLGTIRGYASMLEAGDLGELPPPAGTAVRAIARAAGANLSLLDRLGEMARLESGTERPTRSAHSLAAILAAGVDPLRESARLKGVELAVEVGEGQAEVDLEEMAIAIRNLIGNAIKYASERGPITVSARADGGDSVFEVADRGPGIAPDELPQVFDRYYRANHARTSGADGSGLGLYIVRQIAIFHGGAATAESKVGEGTTFRITIPSEGSALPQPG
jgi:signal transduction histidine kinase